MARLPWGVRQMRDVRWENGEAFVDIEVSKMRIRWEKLKRVFGRLGG